MSSDTDPHAGPTVHDATFAGDEIRDAAYDRLLGRLYERTRAGAPRDPERARRLLARLTLHAPDPWIHVVGTNGKGAVAARIAAGLDAAGYRTLRFLSPHVERFEERVEVAGEPVQEAEVRAFLARAWHDEPDPPAAFFELTLGLALDVAARRGANAAVIEAGVGAARDATAALETARTVVITNVAEDHLEHLGPTVADVARDKADAIRPGRPVVTGATGAPLDIVRTVAAERGAALAVLGDGGPMFAWPDGAPSGPPSGVDGRSARLALAALRTLRLPEPRETAALIAASRDPRLPARRERFRLPGGRTVLLDGAHNPAAAAALAAETPSDAHVLLGVSARKDAQGVHAAFGDVARLVRVAVQRGERPWGDADTLDDAEAALEEALATLPRGGTLVVAGSFYLAGRLRARLREAEGATGPEDDAGYAPRS